MHKLKNQYIEVSFEPAEGPEIVGVLYYNYYGGMAGAYYDPPEGAEIEFSHIILKNDPLNQEVNFCAFCDKYKVDDNTVDDWEQKAFDQIEDSYEEY